jgi:WD40 repeat protein
VLQGHQSVVSSIVYEDVLLSSSLDATVRRWNLKTGECLQTLVAPRPYEGMKVEDVVGLTEAEQKKLETLGAVS